MTRERWLIVYSLGIGGLGWAWLLVGDGFSAAWSVTALFLVLALLIESAGFRVPPADSTSLVGVVILTGVLVLGPQSGALAGALAGLIYGMLQPLIYRLPRTFYAMVGRPLLRSGSRALGVLLGSLVASALWPAQPDSLAAIAVLVLCYAALTQLMRALREWIQGGRTGATIWWSATWRAMLLAEFCALPFAALFAAIYRSLGIGYFVLAVVGLLAASIAIRTATFNLRNQRRSVQELALLNETSRAIIRAELHVIELCSLIYREASKVVDTSSFHLGLFDAQTDRYTLVVRVQDRVRLPLLTVDLPMGDGIVGWMRQTGRALLVNDFLREMEQLPARPRYQSERPPRSGIYIPLMDGGRVIGSISVQSYLPNTFDADDMRVLSLIADQAAVAISKARIFSDARLRAVQLQAIQDVSERITAILDLDELLPSVVHLIRERFGYHPVYIFTLEDDQRLICRASTAEGVALERATRPVAFGEGIVGTVASIGHPLIVNDIAEHPEYRSDDPARRSELAVLLRFGEQRLGVLDVCSDEVGRFEQSDLFVMQTLADQVAVAIESARAFTAQREEAWTTNALLQTSVNLAHIGDLESLLPTATRLPPLLIGCDRCLLLGWDAEAQQFEAQASYGLTSVQRVRLFGSPIPGHEAALLREALGGTLPVAVTDAEAHLCPLILREFGSAAMLVLPLVARGVAFGVLICDYMRPRGTFSERELAICSGMAGQVAVALESAWLAREADKAERLDQELRVARDIQTTLLPAHAPDLPGWMVAAEWRSARIVGGDWYDYWPLDGMPDSRTQRMGFVVADVSDKGVPAAMFMALSRSLVRAAALDGSTPSVALVRANRWITRDSESGMFVTLFYGILDPSTGRLRYCCAGHNPPLLIHRDGTYHELRTPGIALGVLEEVELAESEVIMAPGETLVCYTDGVIDAVDAEEQSFGLQRLIETVLTNRERTASEMIDAMTGALQRYSVDPLFDDVTLMVIKRLPEDH